MTDPPSVFGKAVAIDPDGCVGRISSGGGSSAGISVATGASGAAEDMPPHAIIVSAINSVNNIRGDNAKYFM